ncbi:MAG TPA: nickel-dependent hydrogenase large subunit [Noviherbaspirillum sp.]|uniref:nickel-dependent hydrogenase large subunit n=1 Tax=Noviherbaspirillum sp. TaxID=1926288 RepID=UPI002B462788|nr:nickel-dependent hydrogenase large subunit [Noviherbaspirillum sp.]HJV86643.1 nickel-dependent hydrogenase large subunit [Noviherbaspirillum sp.]
MNLEGKIRIALEFDGRRIVAAAVQPRALIPLNRLLQGRPAAHALQVIPLLFSICGKAQGAAASTAVQVALEQSTAVSLQCERLVLAEALQELLWRFLIDLPRIMQAPSDPTLLAWLRQHMTACCRDGFDETGWQAGMVEMESRVGAALLGDAWQYLQDAGDTNTLMRWLHDARTPTARLLLQCLPLDEPSHDGAASLMPWVNRENMLTYLLPSMTNEGHFASRPHWQGQALETGSLARMQAHPALAVLLREQGVSIFARLLARLLEIHALFDRLRRSEPAEDAWVQGHAGEAAVGLACVQNARGLLLHRVVLDAQRRIADYRIVAPTEWNFHPEGACARSLAGVEAAEETAILRRTELLVHSLDPCVACEIEVNHA